MTEWLRLWHDMPTDPKWRAIARKSGQPLPCVIALFNMILVNASANVANRGTLANWSNEDAAAALDMEEDAVAAIISAMEGKVIDNGRLSGWERRQPKREDGTAAERKAAWKERRNAEERGGTQRNAPETDTDTDTENKQVPEKLETFPGAVGSASDEPKPTAPAETPKSEQPTKKPRGAYPGEFEILWDCYPTNPNESKKLAFERWNRLSKDDQQDCLDGAMAQTAWLEEETKKRRGRDPPPRLHLSTFISERRWETLLDTEFNKFGRNKWQATSELFS